MTDDTMRAQSGYRHINNLINATDSEVIYLDYEVNPANGFLRPIVDLPHQHRDAFERLRVSTPDTRLDLEFHYDEAFDLCDQRVNNGTITHNANARDMTLSLSDANSGSYAWLSSYPVPYTPGNSQLIDVTGCLDLAAIGGGNAEIFYRTKVSGSVETTTYDQSTWSALTTGIDWTKSQLFAIDFQSLKVGKVRFGLGHTGEFKEVYQLNFANTLAGTGYWQLAQGSVFWRIINDATYTYMEIGYGDENNAVGFRYKIAANASATMKAICSTVKSEGGKSLANLPGLSRSGSMGVTAKTVSTTRIPLMSIQVDSTFNSVPNLQLVIPKALSVISSQDIRVDVIVGGTLTGAVFADVDTTNSCVELDTTATAISGGRTEYSMYLAGGKGSDTASAANLLGKSVLWARNDDTLNGRLSICAVRTGGTNASVLAALDWEELR